MNIALIVWLGFSDSNLKGCDLEIRTMIENEEACEEAMKIGSFLNLFLIFAVSRLRFQPDIKDKKTQIEMKLCDQA